AVVAGAGVPLNGIVVHVYAAACRGFGLAKPVDWEPRVGLAWDLFGKGKTVLRLMGGVYHNQRIGGGTGGAGASSLGANPPEQKTFTINNGNIENIANLVALGAAVSFPQTLRALEVHSKTPTIYNFQIGVQQDIGFKTVMEVSYVGSLARHLGEQRDINQFPDTA